MLIPRSVLVILACNPLRTRVCITPGNWKIVVMSKKVQHNMTYHIDASHIMLLPYIYTLYINFLACVCLICEYELRLGKYYQGQKSSACFIPQLKYSDVENELKVPQGAKLECFRSSPGPPVAYPGIWWCVCTFLKTMTSIAYLAQS